MTAHSRKITAKEASLRCVPCRGASKIPGDLEGRCELSRLYESSSPRSAQSRGLTGPGWAGSVAVLPSVQHVLLAHELEPGSEPPGSGAGADARAGPGSARPDGIEP